MKKIKILTLDTETYNGLIGDLKRIAVYDGKKVTYGYNFEDVESVLINYNLLGYEVHVYIHNIEFDLRKIKNVFKKIDWSKSLLINDKVATITCDDYILHDTFKILPSSLSSLCKDFNVTHGKLDLWEEVKNVYPMEYKDHVDFLDRCDIDDELYLRYLGYDVMGLYEVLYKVIELSGLTPEKFVRRVSTSSLSRYIFKNGYKERIFGDNGKTDYEIMTSFNYIYYPELEEFVRSGYIGARTEVFTPCLNGRGYHYDVNSLYPFVMKNNLYPVGKPFFTEKPILAKSQFTRWLDDHNGMGVLNCKVFIPKQPIPPLPVRMGKTVFPCGEVVGTWTYHELEYAIVNCGVEILEYNAVAHWDTVYPVFKNFVSCFYAMKEQATLDKNMSLRNFVKLLLNVGYGYTGMRREKNGLDFYQRKDKYEKIVFADPDAGFCEYETAVDAKYIQPQIAGYVTSFARIELLKALRYVIEHGGKAYYCDTDSVVTDIPFPDSFVDKTELGKWDLEGDGHILVKGLYLRPKVYYECYEKGEDVHKFKGVSKDTQKTFDYNFYNGIYDDLCKGEKEYKVVEKNKLTMRSILYTQKNDLDLSYHEYRDKKINYQTIEKRKMNYKENYTEPLFFSTVDEFLNFNFDIRKNVSFDMMGGAVVG